MKERPTWVIIDTRKNIVLYGIKNRTLAFSTPEIAQEVAEQFFEKREYYLITKIPDLHVDLGN